MPFVKTVNYGLQSLLYIYIGSKLWDSWPSHMKEIDTVENILKKLSKLGNLTAVLVEFVRLI